MTEENRLDETSDFGQVLEGRRIVVAEILTPGSVPEIPVWCSDGGYGLDWWPEGSFYLNRDNAQADVDARNAVLLGIKVAAAEKRNAATRKWFAEQQALHAAGLAPPPNAPVLEDIGSIQLTSNEQYRVKPIEWEDGEDR